MLNVQGSGFWSLLLLLVIISGCISKEEGCLDVAATNYDVTADKDCEDCCTFPNLIIEVDHAAGDTNLIYPDTIFDFDGKTFRITQVTFFLSNLRLSNGTDSQGIEDQIALTNQAGETNVVTNDFTIISRDQLNFSYTIGKFKGTGKYMELRFDVGLSALVSQTDPDNLTTSDLAITNAGDLYDEDSESYTFGRLKVIDVLADDTLSYEINELVSISIPYEVEIDRGFPATIPLKVDYLEWMTGIDFADNQVNNEVRLRENLPDSFSID